MRNPLAALALVFLAIACTGCTYWRQLSKPPTWGMSLPELWQYEHVQYEKHKLANPTLKVTDANSGKPMANARITAIPRPGLSFIDRPRTKQFKTNSDGIVSLKKLPTGAESWITINGFDTTPLTGLIDHGQITIGDVVIELLDLPALEPR